MMAIDPALLPHASDSRNIVRRPPPHVPPTAIRLAADAAMASQPPGPPIQNVQDIFVDGADGPLKARLYVPSDRPGLPLMLLYHGGGFVFGSIATHDPLARTLAAESGCAVAMVEYRLSPECRFPAAQEDCWAALLWFLLNGREYGINPAKVVVAGDSAGAQLALWVAIQAVKDFRSLAGVALFYPFLDPFCDTQSMRNKADGPGISLDGARWLWECHLGDAINSREARLLEAELTGLPPVSLVIADEDPLSDEGLLLAERLTAADVPVTLRRYPGMIHGFLALSNLTADARRAIAAVSTDLKAMLA